MGWGDDDERGAIEDFSRVSFCGRLSCAGTEHFSVQTKWALNCGGGNWDEVFSFASNLSLNFNLIILILLLSHILSSMILQIDKICLVDDLILFDLLRNYYWCLRKNYKIKVIILKLEWQVYINSFMMWQSDKMGRCTTNM